MKHTLTALLLVPLAALLAEEPKSFTNSIGMKLVRIESGTFTMGQEGPPIAGEGNMATHHAEFRSADWDEKPVHRVTITQPFHIGVTEVTLKQFRKFDPDFHKGIGADNDAVHAITWSKSLAFCEWLTEKEGRTYRLPTEAEWEYACRAGTTTLFHTGDTLPAGHQKWFGRQGWRELYFPDGKMPPEYAWQDGATSLSVAQTAPNAWGLHDMHGNVAEWCGDWYGPYESSQQTDPLGRSEGDFRVFRGGSHSMLTRMVRSANRGGWIPDSESAWVGFRVALGDLPKSKPLPPPAPPLNARNVSQQPAKIVPQAEEVPFMEGPRYYRQIPPGEVGPLFTRHNHSPGLIECPNGDLLATWFSCVSEPGPELCNGASRLRFGTKDWEAPSPFWDAPDVNDHAPKLWWDGDKTLIHFAEARGFADNIIRTSTDNGATWSQAKVFFPRGETSNHLIRLRDGTLTVAVDGRSLMVSRDDGLTWTERGKARGKSDLHPGGSGPCIAGIHAAVVELADGRLMAYGRFDDVADQQRFDFRMPVSYSSDLGDTWTYEPGKFPVISNTQRAVLLRLREGPILFCSFTDQVHQRLLLVGVQHLPLAEFVDVRHQRKDAVGQAGLGDLHHLDFVLDVETRGLVFDVAGVLAGPAGLRLAILFQAPAFDLHDDPALDATRSQDRLRRLLDLGLLPITGPR